MPPALAARFDSLARCMEASVVGACVLRDAGFVGRAMHCCLGILNSSEVPHKIVRLRPGWLRHLGV